MIIKTQRLKADVIKSLEEIASFNGDGFKIPIKVFGNTLFVRSQYIVGKGMVTNDQVFTFVKVTLSASAQLKAGLVFFSLISGFILISSIVGFFGGGYDLIPFVGISVISLIPLFFLQIIYFFTVRLQKEFIENLVLHGD